MRPRTQDITEILAVIAEIVAKHSANLTAEILGGVQSVGVGGDNRTYTPVICLTGTHPGNEVLAKISTEISNRTPINRVVIETARRHDPS